MNRKTFKSWLKGLKKAWEEKNPEAAADLMADEFFYFENPFDEPLKTKSEVLKLWQAVPESQKDIQILFDVILVRRDFGLARVWGYYKAVKTGKKTFFDSIVNVTLDRSGKATKFRQWYEKKEL